jgi:pantothenate kinase
VAVTTTFDAALDVVADDIAALLGGGVTRALVGITGPPGAGKSTFADALTGRVGAALVPMDGFHLSNAQLDRLGRRDRKGAVDTFDVDGYVALLERIGATGRSAEVFVPGFDRALDEPVAATHVVPAATRSVVTEGNYLGLDAPGWKAVRPLLHRLYYLDAAAGVRRERLVARHVAGGRSPADAQAWADGVDEPNATVIAASRRVCDRAFVIAESTS